MKKATHTWGTVGWRLPRETNHYFWWQWEHVEMQTIVTSLHRADAGLGSLFKGHMSQPGW